MGMIHIFSHHSGTRLKLQRQTRLGLENFNSKANIATTYQTTNQSHNRTKQQEMCLEILETYNECSCRCSTYKPCKGFLKLVPDQGFKERKKIFFETCNRQEGRRGPVKEGNCGRVGCMGRVRRTGEGLADSDLSREWGSDDGSGQSLKGVIWEG